MRKLRILAVTATTVLLMHCTPDGGTSTEALVLRSYQVPETLQASIVSALSDLVSVNSDVPGLITVTATPSTQGDVQEFITEFSELAASATQTEKPVNIYMEYWLVKSFAGETDNWDPLRVIEEPLRTMIEAQGERQYTLESNFSTLSVSPARDPRNRNSSVSGGRSIQTSIHQALELQEDRITGSIHISRPIPVLMPNGGVQFHEGGINTTVSLIPGRFYILSTSSDNNLESATSTDTADAPTLLYIVRATLVDQE